MAIALHTAASVYFQLKDAGSDRNRQIATKSYLWCWITGFSFLLFLIKTISDRKGLTGQPNIVLRLVHFSRRRIPSSAFSAVNSCKFSQSLVGVKAGLPYCQALQLFRAAEWRRAEAESLPKAHDFA